MSGSGLLHKFYSRFPEITPGKSGINGLIGDVLQALEATFIPQAGIVVEEFTAPLAAATNNVMAASATPALGVTTTLLPVAGGGANELTLATVQNLAAAPRQITFTTAGATPANAPVSATVYGADERGLPTVEVVPLEQVAGAVTTGNYFSNITKIVYAVGKGAGATIAIGLAATIGLSRVPKKRTGVYVLFKELMDGSAAATPGVLDSAADNTAATILGTADLVTATPVLPTTQSIVLAIDGVQKTVTFSNPANLAAVVSQLNAGLGAAVAAAGGVASKFLALTSTTKGAGSSINVISGTGTGAANILTVLGISAGFVRGTSYGRYGAYAPNSAPNGTHSYAIYYEQDATVL
jgi:hypothetical protein